MSWQAALHLTDCPECSERRGRLVHFSDQQSWGHLITFSFAETWGQSYIDLGEREENIAFLQPPHEWADIVACCSTDTLVINSIEINKSPERLSIGVWFNEF